MEKSLTNLVPDIFSLFDPTTTHTPNEENLENFANNIKDLLRVRLQGRKDDFSPLRFSSLGRPDRQLWYMANPDKELPPEELDPKTYFKFLYGDVIEQLVIFLAKEAGHKVEHEQLEIEVNGVKGHIDAIIDGVLVDVKSASPHGYTKFKENTILDNDPFGYVAQLSGYANVLTPGKAAAWIAFDKVSGDMCICPLSASIISSFNVEQRIEHLKEVVSSVNLPNKCYSPEPEGKSGNMKLSTGCSYCPHKFRCWPEVRTFIYSTGPKYLTHVEREPNVFEVKT